MTNQDIVLLRHPARLRGSVSVAVAVGAEHQQIGVTCTATRGVIAVTIIGDPTKVNQKQTSQRIILACAAYGYDLRATYYDEVLTRLTQTFTGSQLLAGQVGAMVARYGETIRDKAAHLANADGDWRLGILRADGLTLLSLLDDAEPVLEVEYFAAHDVLTGYNAGRIDHVRAALLRACEHHAKFITKMLPIRYEAPVTADTVTGVEAWNGEPRIFIAPRMTPQLTQQVAFAHGAAGA